MSKITVAEQGSAPAAPSAGKVVIYAKTDGRLYAKDDAGTEYVLGVTLPLGLSDGGTGGTSAATALAGIGAAAEVHSHTFSDITGAGALASLDTVDTAQIEDGAVTHEKRTYNSGEIVQSVYSEYLTNAALTATIPADDTIPQQTEGTEILTATITPKSATNKIRIRFQGFGILASADTHLTAACFRDAIANALCAYGVTQDKASYMLPFHMEFQETAGNISARTYKIRVGPDTSGGTMYFNGQSIRRYGGVGRATLIVEEIAA